MLIYRKTTIHFIIYSILLCISLHSSAQTDTLSGKDETVVVTATRTERKMSNIAIPVTVINKKTIIQSGSLRLQNILQEQTGLYNTNNFGSGIQIQGLSPDYVLILIDGEPLVGRNGGVLDLSRVTANNIKQIEIVKGPSSSLYGSEAMGGVINIITDKSNQNGLNAGFRYGRFNTIDANVNGSYHYKKFNFSGFANHTASDGYDFDRNNIDKTLSPYQNYTGQIRLQQQLNNNIKIGASFRYYYEKQKDLYGSGNDTIYGTPNIKEYNVNPYAQIHISNKINTTFRSYFTQFQAVKKDYVKRNDSLYYNDFFQQRFQRVENQTDIKLFDNNDLTVGGGFIRERLNTTRYDGIRTNNIGYIFLQDEHRFGKIITAIGGIRYDNNSAYASRISPKIAVNIKASDKLSFNASYGAGFKAPDFRQLYLNMTNNAAGGYTVYGANEITAQELRQQLMAGMLASITPFGEQIRLLKPEYSTGINLGVNCQLNKKISAKINVFRNNIENLIVTKIIAYKPSFAPVFSYFNVKRSFTEGLETEIKYQITKQLRIETGYQFLTTADKEVLDRIKREQILGQRPGTTTSEKVKRGDYGGLNDRSKHMAQLKIFYEKDSWFATIRGLYRSRWGVRDVDGNLILNRDDEYEPGFVQANISGGKTFSNGIQLKAGIDNITNYRNISYLPNQAGINYYVSITYDFFKINRNK